MSRINVPVTGLSGVNRAAEPAPQPQGSFVISPQPSTQVNLNSSLQQLLNLVGAAGQAGNALASYYGQKRSDNNAKIAQLKGIGQDSAMTDVARVGQLASNPLDPDLQGYVIPENVPDKDMAKWVWDQTQKLTGEQGQTPTNIGFYDKYAPAMLTANIKIRTDGRNAQYELQANRLVSGLATGGTIATREETVKQLGRDMSQQSYAENILIPAALVAARSDNKQRAIELLYNASPDANPEKYSIALKQIETISAESHVNQIKNSIQDLTNNQERSDLNIAQVSDSNKIFANKIASDIGNLQDMKGTHWQRQQKSTLALVDTVVTNSHMPASSRIQFVDGIINSTYNYPTGEVDAKGNLVVKKRPLFAFGDSFRTELEARRAVLIQREEELPKRLAAEGKVQDDAITKFIVYNRGRVKNLADPAEYNQIRADGFAQFGSAFDSKYRQIVGAQGYNLESATAAVFMAKMNSTIDPEKHKQLLSSALELAATGDLPANIYSQLSDKADAIAKNKTIITSYAPIKGLRDAVEASFDAFEKQDIVSATSGRQATINVNGVVVFLADYESPLRKAAMLEDYDQFVANRLSAYKPSENNTAFQEQLLKDLKERYTAEAAKAFYKDGFWAGSVTMQIEKQTQDVRSKLNETRFKSHSGN